MQGTGPRCGDFETAPWEILKCRLFRIIGFDQLKFTHYNCEDAHPGFGKIQFLYLNKIKIFFPDKKRQFWLERTWALQMLICTVNPKCLELTPPIRIRPSSNPVKYLSLYLAQRRDSVQIYLLIVSLSCWGSRWLAEVTLPGHRFHWDLPDAIEKRDAIECRYWDKGSPCSFISMYASWPCHGFL